MKHKMVLFIIIGVICAPLIYAGATIHNQHEECKMLHAHLEKVAKELELTKIQKDSIHKIFSTSHDKMSKELEKLSTGHKEMLDLIHKEQFDESAFRAAFKKNSNVLEEVVVQGGKALHQVRGVLTTNQREKLKKIIKLHHANPGEAEACHGELLKKFIKHVHGH